MNQRLKILPPDQHMFTEIMNFLDSQPAFDSVGIVVPTQRLGALILASLASREGALLPPKFFNIESLVDTLFEALYGRVTTSSERSSWSALMPKVPLVAGEHGVQNSPKNAPHEDPALGHSYLMWPAMGGLEQECLLASLIKQNQCRYIRLGHEHELMQLFNEIVQWEVDHSGWTRLQSAIKSNVFLSEGSLDTLHLRSLELQKIFDSYMASLAPLGRLPPTVRMTRRIQWMLSLHDMSGSLEASLLNTSGGPPVGHSFCPTLLFAGLSSLTPLATRLIKTMLDASERGGFFGVKTTFFASTPPRLNSSFNPLLTLMSALSPDPMLLSPPLESPNLEDKGGTPTGQPPHPNHLWVKRTADPLSEVRWCLDRTMELLKAGVQPSSVALLVTDESQYGPYLRLLTPEYLSLNPEGFNIALQMPLKESLIGRWFATLLEWLQFGRGPGDLLYASRFLSHPLVMRAMDQPYPTSPGTEGHHAGKKNIVEALGPRGLFERVLRHMSSYLRNGTSSPKWQDFIGREGLPLGSFLKHLERILSPMMEDKSHKTLSQWAEDLKSFVDVFLPLNLGDLPENFFQFLDHSLDPQSGGHQEPPQGRDQDATEGESALSGQKTTDFSTHEDLRNENIGLRMGSYTGLADFIENLRQNQDESLTLNRKEFLNLVERLFSSLKIQSTGDPFYGVQILGIPEARYIPFQYVFILGALEGQFPRALPHDHVLDNSLKRTMGLPGWQLLEAIEDTTFYLLRSEGAPIVLTYPDGGGAAVRSRFIEVALVLGEALMVEDQEDEAPWETRSGTLADRHQPTLRAPLAGVIPLEELPLISCQNHPETSGKNPMAGLLKTLLTQSPTSLKSLFQCPYRYFLEQALGDPLTYEDDFSAVREGKALHRVMELFFEKKESSTFKFPLQQNPPQNTPWQTFFTQRLHRIAETSIPEDLQGSPLLLHMKLKGWEDFAKFLCELFVPHGPLSWAYLQRARTEVSFRFDKPMGIPLGPMSLRGRIDLILTTPMGSIVIDFKRKKYPSRIKALLGDDPQMLIYGMAFSQMEKESRDVSPQDAPPSPPLASPLLGYYSLIDGVWAGVACGPPWDEVALEKNLLSSKTPDDLDEILSRFESRVANHLQTIIQGPTPPLSQDTGTQGPSALHFWIDTRHCDDCSFSGICRKEEELHPVGFGLCQEADRKSPSASLNDLTMEKSHGTQETSAP